MQGLYIHVPFCAKVCDYCDFSVLAAPERMYVEYLDLVLRELACVRDRYPEKWASIETLYLGGGTPSILPPELLVRLFSWLRDSGVCMENLREASMEVNPESCLEERLDVAMSFGVNRFSVGIQTFDAELLKAIGRAHSVETGLRALDTLCSLKGKVQVNADLMFCLPNQSTETFLADVKRLSEYPLNHISFYGLNVSEHTVLGNRIQRGKLHVDEELYAPMYNGGVQILKEAGFERYEVSNFAKPGFESLHNKNYWNRGEYFGVGPGAHSYLGKVRFYAPEKYSRWKSFVLDGCAESLYSNDVLNRESAIAETIWLSLRQSAGLDVTRLASDFNYTLPESKIEHWVCKGYLQRSGNVVKLVDDGWLFMDQVVEDFMV